MPKRRPGSLATGATTLGHAFGFSRHPFGARPILAKLGHRTETPPRSLERERKRDKTFPLHECGLQSREGFVSQSASFVHGFGVNRITKTLYLKNARRNVQVLPKTGRAGKQMGAFSILFYYSGCFIFSVSMTKNRIFSFTFLNTFLRFVAFSIVHNTHLKTNKKTS